MWIYLPTQPSSPSAPESEDSILESDWRFQALERSVSWRGKQRVAKSWHRAWKKGGWLPRLFGRMSRPSTAQRGVDAWILSLRATHANPSPVQEPAKELKTLDTSGLRSSASSENVGQLSLFSKMSKDISPRDFVKSSKISWNWGSMRSGVFTQLPKPDLRSAETECSSWRTPAERDHKGVTQDQEKAEMHLANGQQLHLNDQACHWPTPIVGDAHLSSTPEAAARRIAEGKTTLSRVVDAKAWPTPGANDHKGSSKPGQRRGQLDEAAEQLHTTLDLGDRPIAAWTPCPCCENYLCHIHTGHAHDCPCPPVEDWESRGLNPYLTSPPAPKETGQESPKNSGLRLNPLFVEWLMGFPSGWISLGHSGMPLSPNAQTSHSEISGEG